MAEKFQPEVIQWKKLSDGTLEEFSKILESEDGRNRFTEEWVKDVSDRAGKVQNFCYKALFVYYVLMIVLFTAQYQRNFDFQIFGLAAKGVNEAKEYLLFIAVSAGVVYALSNAYAGYLNSIARAALKKFANEKSAQYYEHRYFISSSGVIGGDSIHFAKHHFYTKAVFLALILSLAFMMLLIFVGGVFVPISVIVDIIHNPSSPTHVNWFVVTYSVSAMVFGLSLMLVGLPLPHVNRDNYQILADMENTNNNRYLEIMAQLAADDLKKEKIFANTVSLIIFGMMFSVASMAFIGFEYVASSDFAFKGGVGAVIVWITCPPTIIFIKRRVTRWFFVKYRENGPERLAKFKKLQKFRLIVSYVIPLLVSGYVVYNHVRSAEALKAVPKFVSPFVG